MTKLKQSKEIEIFLSLEVACKQIKDRIRQILSSYKLKLSFEQWMIIKSINDQQGINQNKIADFLSKDKASISRIVALLIKREYIIKKKNELDKKHNKLFLTPKGLECIQLTDKSIVEEFKNTFSNYHEKEINIIIDIIQKIK